MEYNDIKFRDIFVRKKQFDKVKKEINDDEEVLALTLTYSGFSPEMGIVIITDKRVMIRPANRFTKTYVDIFLKDIELDSIKTHDIKGMVEFTAFNELYKIFDPRKPLIQMHSKLADILREKIGQFQKETKSDDIKITSHRTPKFCPECGNKIVENAKFCSECGNKF